MEASELSELLRIEGGRVLATLIRLTGDIDRAEDAVQEAVVAALETWPRSGVPDRPGAWLTTAARRRALDRIRRESTRSTREAAATRLLDDRRTGDPDAAADPLRLLFTCCHPALSPEARVALALRTLCGLSTTEIARAFLVAEPTIGQRISRAKRKIATARIPYRVPADHELPDRLPAVLSSLYLTFTMGHHPADGALDARVDLAAEALRMSRLLLDLMPDEPECAGLVALLVATHARRAARLDGAGDVVLLDAQDRRRWDHEAIAEAATLIDHTLRRRRPGPYQAQAAIAVLHGLVPTFADTDWCQIAELYRLLERWTPTPVVRVNRAVADAHARGPAAGLALLDTLDPDTVSRWHLYHSTRAELLARLERRAEAAGAFRRALDCPTNDSDRRFLRRRLAEVQAGTTSR